MHEAQDSRILLERVATQTEMHIESDTRIFAEIQHDNKNILAALNAMGDRMEKSVERIHGRIDTGLSELREHADHGIDGAMALAQAAHDKIASEKATVLTKAISILVGLLGAGGVGAVAAKKIGGP